MAELMQFESDARTAGVDYFHPDETLITPIKRATANAQNLYLKLDGVGELLVMSERGEYFALINNEQQFYTSPLAQFTISVLTDDDQRLPGAETVGRNIDELMWRVGYHASSGRLMHGCFRDDVVELAHWPNLSRLPHSPNSARIAALLASHPTSITFATRLLKIEQAELFQFYSAARCAGLARPINRAVQEPKLAPHRNQNLLSALLGKIARL